MEFDKEKMVFTFDCYGAAAEMSWRLKCDISVNFHHMYVRM